MHLIYGLSELNARAAKKLYREKYPHRHAPNHRISANLHPNMCEYGSLRDNRYSKLVVVLDDTEQLESAYVMCGCRSVQRTNVVDRIHLSAPLHLRTVKCSVRKTSNAWSTLDAEPLTSPPPMCAFLTLNSQHYISEVLEPVVLPYLQGLATAIFQQDNAQPHVARIVQRFFVNHQIELFPCPARSPDLSPIENMWSMVAQRLTQITPPAVTPDQLRLGVEAS
ncbi:transposable element Tcb1 transposase [Trichonephila clavipes]|nr:transposable element Tcb1 transposase [Trichonephila clavipes]